MRHDFQRHFTVAAICAFATLTLGACADSSSVTEPKLQTIAESDKRGADRDGDGAVYLQTNAARENMVVAFVREDDGELRRNGNYRTGGSGTGVPRLGSQNSVLLSPDGHRLFVVNAGSNEISVFAVGGHRKNGKRAAKPARLTLIQKISSGGQMPLSLTLHGHLLYVVNAGGEVGGGTDNITAFRLNDDGELAPLSNSTRALSASNTKPAEVEFSPDGRALVVTERATDKIDTYAVGADGRATGPVVHPSSGAGPFGFAFRHDGVFVVTESFNGAPGLAAASSYALLGTTGLTLISGTVRDSQSDVCWTVITADERYAYITNNGSGTISSYRIEANGGITLLEAVAGVTGSPGGFGTRDAHLSRDSRFLYAIDVGTRRVNAFAVTPNGGLTKIAEYGDFPATLAGLAAR